MEIVKQTEKELVVKDKLLPRFRSLFVFVFTWMGILLSLSLKILPELEVIKASCQRVEPTQVNCQVNNSKYLGLTPGFSTSLTQVTEAKFNYQKYSDVDSNYFVTLLAKTGKKVVIWQGNSYQEMNEMVAKINTFINNSTQPSLLIQYDLRWKWENLGVLTFIILFFVLGVLLIYISLYLKTLIINKSEGQLTYKVFSLLGSKTKHYSFAQIQRFILESYTNKDEDGDEYTSYSFKVVLPRKNRNNPFEITLMSNSDIAKVKETANTVSNFIDIPYQKFSNK